MANEHRKTLGHVNNLQEVIPKHCQNEVIPQTSLPSKRLLTEKYDDWRVPGEAALSEFCEMGL